MPRTKKSRPAAPNKRSTRRRAGGDESGDITSDAAVQRVCEAVEAGKSIESACAAPGMPSVATIRRWLRQPGEDGDRWRALHTEARLEAGKRTGDRVMQIADDVLTGKITPDQGRVAIDAAKWTAARANRAVWGDRVEVDHSGSLAVNAVRVIAIDGPNPYHDSTRREKDESCTSPGPTTRPSKTSPENRRRSTTS